jgi:WD40 repeat protein
MEVSSYQINNGNIVSPTNSELEISENNILLSNFSIECDKHDTSQKYSLIFAIDMSNSVDKKKKDLITSIIITFLNNFDLTKGEVAIIGFNDYNFLLHDFSSDKQSLFKFIDNVSAFSCTDFDAAFINPTYGALKISKSAKYKCKIILINDGSAPISKDNIINEALKQNVNISNVTLSSQTSESILDITTQTGGLNFSNLNDLENSVNIGEILAFYSQGFQPCKLTWKSLTCSSENNLSIKFDSKTSLFNFIIEKSKLPYLEITPSSSIDFGFVDPTSSSSSKLKLVPRNRDLKINGIIDNPVFKLSGISENMILRKDSVYNIKVTYKPADSNYAYFEINLLTDICDVSIIRVSGGKISANDEPHNLRVISPNGGEVFVNGQTYKLRWDGVLETDTVSIEYSVNSGTSWQLITDKAVGLEYEWNLIPPKLSSNQCLLKVEQLSKNSMSQKIIKLTGISGEVVGIKWSKDNSKILTGSTDGFLRYWNAKSGEVLKSYNGAGIEDLKFLKFFDISSDEKTISYVSKNEDMIILFDTLSVSEIDTVKIPNKKCTAMNWNPSGNILSVGTDDGSIYFWDYPNKIPIKVISTGSRINTLVWSNKGEFLAAGLFDGNVKIYNINGDSITSIKNSDVEINSISWNKSGKIIGVSSLLESVNIWDINNPNVINSIIEYKKPVNIVEWDPLANYIATASADSSIKLWNPASSKMEYKFGFHNNIVKSLKWSSDGKYIASGTLQGEVLIWSPDDIYTNTIIQQDSSDIVWSIVNPVINIKDVHFTQKYLNKSVDTTVSSFIINSTQGVINIDSVQIYGDTKQMFNVDNSIFPLQLKPNERIDLKFGFNPVTIGMKNDTILIFNGFNITKKIISGIGIAPQIRISPQFLDFGEVNLGDSSIIESVIIENISDTEVNILYPEITGNWNLNFSFIDFDINPLAPNEKRNLQIKYKPLKVGSVSAITIFDFPDLIDSEILILNGKAVAPQIDILKEVELPALLCDNKNSQLIYEIKNNGNAVLKIDSIKLSDKSNQGFFLDISGMSDVIQADNSTYFTIGFTNANIGTKWAYIEIFSNYNSDGSRLNEVLVQAKRESVEILPTQFDINFYVNIDQSEQKTFYIINSGSVPIRCDTLTALQKFEFISINPRITLPGDSSEVIIFFPGSPDEGIINEQLQLRDTCNNIYTINLNSYIGMKNAKISIPEFINFRDLICEQISNPIKVYMYNIGTSPLIIEKIVIEDIDFNDFTILKNVSNFKILPGKKDSVEISFSPKLNSTGQKKTHLHIYSNSSNSILGINEIELNAFKGFYDFSFSVDTLLIDNAFERIQYFDEFDIVNTGNLPLTWSSPQNLTYFVIDSIKPETTFVNSRSKVFVRFKGASPKGIYEDIFKTDTLCGIKKQIVLRANITGKANAGLRVGQINAAPGDSLELPIYLFSPAQIELPDVIGYKTTVSFNATLLVPTSQEKGEIVNGIRYIDLEFPGALKTEGLIGSIRLIASLGNCDSTLINLSNSSAINDNLIKIEEEGGIFYLDSVCYKGGPRLIGGIDTLKLFQNEPNPVNEDTKFKFSIIEKGLYSLELYDLNGRFIKLIFKGNLNPGLFEILVNFKDLAAGNYIYILQTPQIKLYKKLTINR